MALKAVGKNKWYQWQLVVAADNVQTNRVVKGASFASAHWRI